MTFKDKLKRKINNKLLRFSYKFTLSRALALMPNSLDIELTNRCNLNCSGCPRKKMNRPYGDMSFDLFKRIIDKGYPYIYFSWLHLFGEPLLNSNVAAMVSYASKKQVACGISTNATVLNQELARNLCMSKLDTIIISIDATTDQTYNKIRRGGNFGQVIKNTETLLNLPERKNIKHTIIQMVKMKKNQHEVDDFINKWKGFSRNVHIKEEDSWAGYFKNNSKSNSIMRFPCCKLWDRLTVDWQGNVSICCRDFRMQVNLGNLKTDGLKSLWNGNKMVALRKSHINNKLDDVPLCQHCKEWIFSDPNYKNYESY
jgi:radical SAM protein with 4Fe4S-binding SPASM domain